MNENSLTILDRTVAYFSFGSKINGDGKPSSRKAVPLIITPVGSKGAWTTVFQLRRNSDGWKRRPSNCRLVINSKPGSFAVGRYQILICCRKHKRGQAQKGSGLFLPR
ncbi:hypothetical protein K239x_38250 [Planctomycetes bacterium K23_9]|uniref:Uncharacterized protein n=1 Tax=Stieleria marina TaxID=1930275 RepID=A0A517NXF7_9BACT|nr:hypothetical protein K239x_38250 [Planctomycetes bacterium K23_9]